jgi:hypothetical protein
VPFKSGSFVNPNLTDARINGKIFFRPVMKESLDELLHRIDTKRKITYVGFEDTSRGYGKSAVLAAAYWELKSKSKGNVIPIWVSIIDFRRMEQVLVRIVDAMVTEGILKTIKDSIGELTQDNVRKRLSDFKISVSPSEVSALREILKQEENYMPWRFSNLRRTYKQLSLFEIFVDLVELYVDKSNQRMVIFLDQFEDFVIYHYGSRLIDLTEELRDVMRAAAQLPMSMIMTIHPDAEVKIQQMPEKELISYGAEIRGNVIRIPRLDPQGLIGVAKCYLAEFRPENFDKNKRESYPFDEALLHEVAERSNGNLRRMLTVLLNILNEAMSADYGPPIDSKYLKDTRLRIRVGLEFQED